MTNTKSINPPCNLGDTVYYVHTVWGQGVIDECKALELEYHSKSMSESGYFYNTSDYWLIRVFASERDNFSRGLTRLSYQRAKFNYNVFLTKQEAEATLRKGVY